MLTLREVMTHVVVTVPPELSVRAAMALLVGHHISGAPVVAGGDVIGVISATDVLRFVSSLPRAPTERPAEGEFGAWEPAASWEEGEEPPAAYFSAMAPDAAAELEERFGQTTNPEWVALDEHTVSDVMTRRVCHLPPTATVAAAADYMQRAGIHRVLVMQNAQLLGIVTAHDIATAVAERRVVERRPTFDGDARFDERGWE